MNLPYYVFGVLYFNIICGMTWVKCQFRCEVVQSLYAVAHKRLDIKKPNYQISLLSVWN